MPNPGEALPTLGKLAFETLENKVSNETVNNWASKIFGLSSQLTGESGAALQSYLKKFEAVRDTHMAAATKAISEYKANPVAFDAKVKAGQYNKRYHQTISQAKGDIEPYILSGSAKMQARNEMFGPKDELMQGFINHIATEKGEGKAKNIVDALGIYFHDTAYEGNIPGSETSRLSHNLSAKNSEVEDINFKPSRYKAPGDIERNVNMVMAGMLAYKAGLKHTVTPLNSLIGRTLTSAAKASTHLFGSGYDAAKAEMLSLNAVGQIFAEEHQQMYDFQHGIIKNYAPGSVGEFLSKNFLIPGFTAVRQRTATMLAMQGKYAAMELAERLKLPDVKLVERAKYDLRRLGLNPDLIRTNGYKLSPAEIRTAMFNNTNDRMFLQSGMSRSSFATGSTLGRMLGMYHAYGSAQANFIQQELVAAVQKGDPVSFVKTMAILGTVFPAAGAAVGYLSHLWGAKGVDKSTEQLREDLGLVEGKRMSGLIDAYANTAGFGIMESYFNSLTKNKLADVMIGPEANTLVEGLQDTAKAVKGVVTGADAGKDQWKAKTYDPLIRDIIHDIPSAGLLPFIARTLDIAPTQQELNARKPKTSKQILAKEKRARKKAALKP